MAGLNAHRNSAVLHSCRVGGLGTNNGVQYLGQLIYETPTHMPSKFDNRVVVSPEVN